MPGYGFKYVFSDAGENGYATIQVYEALVASKRFVDHKSTFFDMRDVEMKQPTTEEGSTTETTTTEETTGTATTEEATATTATTATTESTTATATTATTAGMETTTPKTGDEVSIMAFAVLGILSAVGGAVAMRRRK